MGLRNVAKVAKTSRELATTETLGDFRYMRNNEGEERDASASLLQHFTWTQVHFSFERRNSMSVAIQELHNGQLLHISITGKLSTADYDTFVPAMERSIAKHGKISLVVELLQFEGWSVGALWKDIKFDWNHARDFHRLAMIGDKKWESAMATFCKPFTTAEVRYFNSSERQNAVAWAGEVQNIPAATHNK